MLPSEWWTGTGPWRQLWLPLPWRVELSEAARIVEQNTGAIAKYPMEHSLKSYSKSVETRLLADGSYLCVGQNNTMGTAQCVSAQTVCK